MTFHLHDEHRDKLMKFYIHGSIWVIIISLMIISYYKYIDGVLVNQPVTFGSYLLQTTKQVYYPGEVVEARISICKHRDVTPTVRWALVDTYLRFYPERQGGLFTNGCYTDKIIQIEKIPTDAYPGVYYFTGEISYTINRYRTMNYELKTNIFDIITNDYGE